MRQVIAQRMHAAHQTSAPVTLTCEADATALVELRETLATDLVDELSFRITYTDLLIAICAKALHKFPYMNARLEGNEILHLAAINIGVAIDAPHGLLVPVIRDAQCKSIAQIATELRSLAERARNRQASPEELSGGTFTITNLGIFGIDAFTPIINLPETAILGVGRIAARPRFVEGQLVERQVMWLSLTFDHRLVDGAPAAGFLQCIVEVLEQPYPHIV